MPTFYLDVKSNGRALERFEVSFAVYNEAIEHSRELAARLKTLSLPAQSRDRGP